MPTRSNFNAVIFLLIFNASLNATDSASALVPAQVFSLVLTKNIQARLNPASKLCYQIPHTPSFALGQPQLAAVERHCTEIALILLERERQEKIALACQSPSAKDATPRPSFLHRPSHSFSPGASLPAGDPLGVKNKITIFRNKLYQLVLKGPNPGQNPADFDKACTEVAKALIEAVTKIYTAEMLYGREHVLQMLEHIFEQEGLQL